MPRLIITFQERLSEIEAPRDGRLDEILLGAGYLVERQCAGRGTCGRCKIVAKGELGEVTGNEKERLGAALLAGGWRLACQVTVVGDASVELKSDIVHSDKIFGKAPPLKELPARLGLALDLGTTTVAAFLIDMETGRVIAGHAVLNMQSSYGADVISRLEKSEAEGRLLAELAKESLIGAIDGLKLSKKAKERIGKAVVVGNTAMHHLFLGLATGRLRVRPFEPADLDARRELDVGLGFKAWIPPVIGGFVGSDTLACLAYFGFERGATPAMAADLGTNGEVMVSDGERILVSSTAAGPAFEGVNISCGARAAPGAVVRVRWHDDPTVKSDRIIFETIGEKYPPIGLAGSGLLSLIRLLREKGLIAESGRIIDPEKDVYGMVGRGKDGKRISLGKDICITQDDIREMQKAKGAVRACADALLDNLGMKPGDLKRVYLTGSFGGRLDVRDVLELGVLPPVEPGRVISIANGAGLGAALFLKEDEFNRAEQLARRVEHIPLFDSQSFIDNFIANMVLRSQPTGRACR